MLRVPRSLGAAILLAISAAGIMNAPRLNAATGAGGRGTPGRGSAEAPSDTAVFAGGCFWGIEAVFEHLKGVTSAVSGYTGGSVASPSYEEVSSGNSGHAESVQVVYDPKRITYAQLLKVFFTVAHDPTQRNRQGPDVGTQYRSAVFYRDTAQQRAATAYVAELGQAKAYPRPIVTEIVPLRTFYPAEDYHQNYMAHHPKSPYIVYNDLPKVKRLEKEFPTWYRDNK
jgi:peptide-methionine (S)-S-oxide reductase